MLLLKPYAGHPHEHWMFYKWDNSSSMAEKLSLKNCDKVEPLWDREFGMIQPNTFLFSKSNYITCEEFL